MDVFEFAMQMEKDGEKYYLELMRKSKAPGLQKIFAMLADEEVKHYTFIEQLRIKSGVPQIEETRILDNVKNIFIEMKDGKQGLYIDTTEETTAYRKARDIEEMSRKFYMDKSEELKDEQVSLHLRQLAREEEKHLLIMESIVEFVSRPEPGNWLENAEWHHLDEY